MQYAGNALHAAFNAESVPQLLKNKTN